MTEGPGNYDSVASLVLGLTGAETVVLMVINGVNGSGFEVQSVNPNHVDSLPARFRWMADEIEDARKCEVTENHQ